MVSADSGPETLVEPEVNLAQVDIDFALSGNPAIYDKFPACRWRRRSRLTREEKVEPEPLRLLGHPSQGCLLDLAHALPRNRIAFRASRPWLRGTRTILDFQHSARLIAWRIHRMANVENRTPRSGSNRFTAPREAEVSLLNEVRSWRGGSRPGKFLAKRGPR